MVSVTATVGTDDAGIGRSPGITSPRPPGTAQGALVESRQRWRDLARLAADLTFETDAAGRLGFLAPEDVLGWSAAALLGQRPAEAGLLVQPDPDPFALGGPARDLRAWLRRADGGEACLSFSVAPLTGPDGGFAGLRGTGRDITAEVLESEAQAAALRRALAVQSLLRRVREAVLAPRMLPALLGLLPSAIGCAGAMLVEIDAAGRPTLPQMPGLPVSRLGLDGLGPLRAGQPAFFVGAAREPVALVPQGALAVPGTALAGVRPQALLIWREPGDRPFDADERHLLQGLSDVLGVVLGNQHLLSEMERQARTDGMTGLLNRSAFLAELHRRLERQRRAGVGGVLIFLDVDNLKPVNDRLGHEAGDALLRAVAELLRQATRPSDLAARLGGDEFALWLDGVAAEAVARERAEALCASAAAIDLRAPRCGTPIAVTISIGIALATQAMPGETAEALLARADAALYTAKRGGRNAWSMAPGT